MSSSYSVKAISECIGFDEFMTRCLLNDEGALIDEFLLNPEEMIGRDVVIRLREKILSKGPNDMEKNLAGLLES